ncbi:WD repeat-containing protein 64-like isoform X2 [Mustela putorius furo]|uniref:WD repeat-containing protein 64-like isoform X2 n=1 Tax=Mustela putorius furo TaxID=9669 RepID=A0A8U0UT75_MUSPF|nr:WD repeat-containing protein 64-like isoform X2 [Mustela putorius furo]
MSIWQVLLSDSMNWRRRRAGSALGRLETSHVNSLDGILDAAAILGEPVMLRVQTCPAGPRPSQEQGLQRADTPAWLLRACLTRQRMRSHSIGMEDLAQGRTPPHHADLVRSLRADKIEHQVTLEELQNLSALFQEYEKRGRQLLDMETFKCIMKQSMRSQNKNIEQIQQLFMKIDYESVGRIQWDGLCTYLQLEYSEQAAALARQKEVSFQLPAALQGLSYGGPVLRILSMPDDTLIMIREDGAIYFWSLQLKLKRRKRVFDKSTSRKPRWVTDVISMPQYNKLLIGTGNREIQLYELSNLEPYCQIGGLEAVPLKLDYCYEDPDKCLILYGDDQGCVNILSLASVRELLRTWKKLPQIENMPNISINHAVISPNVNYIRWKVHGDWVTQLNYYDSIKAVISSSNHEPTALVIGCTTGTTNVKQKMKEIRGVRKDVEARREQAFFGLPQRRAECDQTVFHIYKGVKAFSFCKRKNLLLTGGMDRIIRVWNPYLPGKPTGMLKSHTAPVIYIHVSAEDNKIFSMSTDNTIKVVKVWDFETGRLLSGFTGAHGNAGITCLTFDTSGRRLITGGRDGCLKIWSYNNGHCLHTLKQDEKQSEVCDCTYVEVNQNRCIIAVGWDRRINVYFDAPRDFHHFWKPQPHWQDDLNHGHKEDILCVAQCPPFLLATSSYDGEVIIWNVISGHIYCKLNTPPCSDDAEDGKGSDRCVSCLTFLKSRAAKFESVAASLITNGPGGSVTFWKLFGGACPIANFTPSRDKAQVSSITVTAGDALAYVADQEGFVHVYDIKEYGLQGPELQSPKNVTFWRAHVSVVTSLELIEEKFLLSSSLDHTVRLWSADGKYIGTFGQQSPWDIFTPASWSHPRVPCEILTDPQSTPAHPVLGGDVAVLHTKEEEQDKVVEEKAKPEKTPNPRFPEDPIPEVEMKEDIDQWLPLDWNPPSRRTCGPGWPSIYQTLRCHEVTCVSAVGEKPDLSIIGSDLFNVNFLTKEQEGGEAAQEH